MLTARQRLAGRLSAQLLSGPPATSVQQVTERLLAVQAQDPRGFRLAVRARSRGITAGHVDAALDSATVVVGWLNRGTLHLVAAEDYRRLHRLTAPQLLTSCTSRLAQLGIDPAEADRGVDAIVRALRDGPATRAALAEKVAQVGVAVAGQAMPHLLFLASARGLVVRGPTRGLEQAYVLVGDWLPADASPPDRERDLAWLAHRYLRGHGPATEADLARWAKLPLRDVRAGLRSIADTLVDLGDGLVDLSGRASPRGFPPPRLLGQWDAVLCGWVSRDDIVGELGHGIVTDNGLFRPFAMVDGRAVAIWRYNGGRVTIDPLRPLPDDVAAALDADARAVERFFAGG